MSKPIQQAHNQTLLHLMAEAMEAQMQNSEALLRLQSTIKATQQLRAASLRARHPVTLKGVLDMITTSQPKVARLSDHERDLRQTNIKLALPFITDSGTRARFLEMLADEAEDRWDDASNAVPA